MNGTTTKLTDPHVQSGMLKISCGSASQSIDLPEGTKTFVVTNPTKFAGAWISFGAKDAELTAVVGVGHHLAGGDRLILEKSSNVAKVAAIAEQTKHGANLVIYVEYGEGGLKEHRNF